MSASVFCTFIIRFSTKIWVRWCLDCPTRKKKNSKDPLGVIDGSWNNERLTFCVCTCVFKFLYITEGTSYIIYYTHSEITGGPCNLISSNWCDLFTNRTIFCFKSHLFPSQGAGHTTNKKTNQISRLVLSNQSNCRKMIDKEYRMANFATFVFPPKKWMSLISNRLSTASIKYLNWPSPAFGLFQNECNEVVIEPRVVQFWSEIILVFSNWTRAARSIDFEITCMITPQIALHSVQYHCLSPWKGGPGPGPGPGQGDFEENTRGTEKSVANEGHQSLFIAWEGGGGEAESENFGGNTGGTEKFIANEEHQSLFIAREEGCGVGRLWGEHRGNREVKSK